MSDLHALARESEEKVSRLVTKYLAGEGAGALLLAEGPIPPRDELLFMLGSSLGFIAELTGVVADIMQRPGDRLGVWSEYLVQRAKADG